VSSPRLQAAEVAAQKYDILAILGETDPNLAMKTRRGTAITKGRRSKYLVLRMFEHNSRWATLEVDRNERATIYFPTGFESYSAKKAVLKGHPFESFLREGPWSSR
jgi:hypothetical protein